MSETRKITIEIDNLTEAQVLAISDMLRLWEQLGSMGSSRWTAFFADGDGNFHPKVLIDGKPPERCLAGKPDDKHRWHHATKIMDAYLIDFDEIAWWVRDQQEKGPQLVTP